MNGDTYGNRWNPKLEQCSSHKGRPMIYDPVEKRMICSVLYRESLYHSSQCFRCSRIITLHHTDDAKMCDVCEEIITKDCAEDGEGSDRDADMSEEY